MELDTDLNSELCDPIHYIMLSLKSSDQSIIEGERNFESNPILLWVREPWPREVKDLPKIMQAAGIRSSQGKPSLMLPIPVLHHQDCKRGLHSSVSSECKR